MLYLVTVTTATIDKEGWAGAIQSPTFLLDSTIQGITNEAHAELIVFQWMRELGQEVIAVSVTPAPNYLQDKEKL